MKRRKTKCEKGGAAVRVQRLVRRRVVVWGGMDPLCQVCSRPAVTRWKNAQDDLVAAACAEHREEVKRKLQ